MPRDKYSFVPAAGLPGTHAVLQQDIIDFFAGNKARRKASSVNNLTALAGRLANPGAMPGAAIHAALHTYEQDYLKHGGDWQKMKSLLRIRYPTALRLVETPTQCTIYGRPHAGGERILGVVHLGDARFTPMLVQPFANNPTIYEREGDPGRHYIRLTTSATFVKRFVTRGLNGFDGMNLTANLPLLAAYNTDTVDPGEIGGTRHAVVPATVLNVQQQILSHTRGWKKRFISAGVSNRNVHSTRGTQFISMYGVVTIDLARVPLGTIYDVHRPDVAAIQLGRPASDVEAHPAHLGTNDHAEQQYLALRDVLRTREILIKGTVPVAAIVRVSEGMKLLGVGSTTGPQHNGVAASILGLPPFLQGLVTQQDVTTFRDVNTGRRWHFIAFANAASCLAFEGALPIVAGQVKVRFNKYNPGVTPAGMLVR